LEKTKSEPTQILHKFTKFMPRKVGENRSGQDSCSWTLPLNVALLLPDLVDLWGTVGLQLGHQDTNDVHEKHQVNLIIKTELTKSRRKLYFSPIVWRDLYVHCIKTRHKQLTGSKVRKISSCKYCSQKNY
jgi:hypothetical protein